MKDHQSIEPRRKLLGLAAVGIGASAASVLSSTAQAAAPAGVYASWVHGHSGVLERGVLQPSKANVKAAFRNLNWDGDLRDFGGSGAIAVSRLGSAARFIVFDYGTDNNPKSGAVWCHYSVPTPVLVGDQRATFARVLVNLNVQSPQQLTISQLHVWDGPDLVIQRNDVALAAGPSVLFRDIPARQVSWGTGVSLLIVANNARNVKLDVSAVGVDFTF